MTVEERVAHSDDHRASALHHERKRDEPRRVLRLRAPRESPRSGSRDFATQRCAEYCTRIELQRLE